ncbi:hypothetical protein DH2020_047594 [Rehmannia glutinosa]|uniref:WAT1-related protein n=1 Tax=Rehmannia glutinosa TaxID=99300 RepID=A0ABR0U8R5_REHGL
MRKYRELMPTIMMIIVQIALAGGNIFYKLAGNNGMSLRVLIAYRFIFAAVIFVPLALIIERNNRPKLTWKIAFQGFLVALFGGSMGQNLYAESLVQTSATFVAAMCNLIPAITFILTIFFRMERLGLDTKTGRAKVIGTITCIGGAMVLTFYKGCDVNLWSTHFDILHNHHQPRGQDHPKCVNHIFGPFLTLVCCFCISLSFIIQGKMSKTYPCLYSSTALISIMGSVQALVFALCTERNCFQWKLGWDLKLLIVAYMGIMASGIASAFILSCVRARGPLFVSIFNPLLLVLVALAGSLFLNEKLHLGSVLGAIIIVCGLYSVLWGESKQEKKITPLKRSLIESTQSSKNAEKRVDDFNNTNNIMAVAPDFVPESEILQVFDGEEEDLEAVVPKPQTNSGS